MIFSKVFASGTTALEDTLSMTDFSHIRKQNEALEEIRYKNK